jgi:hypothetical protein
MKAQDFKWLLLMVDLENRNDLFFYLFTLKDESKLVKFK